MKCISCEKRCIIRDHHSGYCCVRFNDNGNLYLAVYGYPCALQIDPIEKKPLFHFLPGSKSLSIGTLGCNYRCSFCQNWSISQCLGVSYDQIDIEDLLLQSRGSQKYISPSAIVDFALRAQCSSICFTYNEPTIWVEYARDIAEIAHAHGLKCVYVTNGSMTAEHLQYIRPFIDAMNVDLKAWSSDFYRQLCIGDVDIVRENIKRIWNMGIWLEVTTLIIPGKNDSDMELSSIARFIAGISPTIPWHISAFHPVFKMREVNETPIETMRHASEIGKKAGLKYIYIGNVYCADCEDTFCPKCKERLIERNLYQIHFPQNKQFSGFCPKCRTQIDGVWKFFVCLYIFYLRILFH